MSRDSFFLKARNLAKYSKVIGLVSFNELKQLVVLCTDDKPIVVHSKGDTPVRTLTAEFFKNSITNITQIMV
ncbi:hypothetical protein T4B_11394 [Trichinella pseudospiralis]|uniref:Uncharacterized protein n=1 Tax=Trichinella pseudospiralis TaxID=6337 RepID=A0A0V1GN57_TRIPS|nr:hypothetical protein T4B_11394 [Trichinella pseudospiralis]